MQQALESARQLVAGGQHKEALDALRAAEADARDDPVATKALIDVVYEIRKDTHGRTRKRYDELLAHVEVSRQRRKSVQHDPTAAPLDRSTDVAGQRTTEPRTPEEIDVLMRRADVSTTEVAAQGPLTAERVLAVCGRWPTGVIGLSATWARGAPAYDIYDSAGSRIGAAVRFKDRYKEVGYRYHYELRDTELRCVLRDVTPRGRLGQSGLDAFSVLGADGVELGTLTNHGLYYELASRDQPVAEAHLIPWHKRRRVFPRDAASVRWSSAVSISRWLADRLTNKVWWIEDEPGHRGAHITYVQAMSSYVVELYPSLKEPLRTLALTFCLVADNRIIDRGVGSGIGGA